MGAKTKIYLDDHGQDFLWFVVDDKKIVKCGPFQAWLWVGKHIMPPKKWRKGSRVVFKDGSKLKYPVIRAEPVS